MIAGSSGGVWGQRETDDDVDVDGAEPVLCADSVLGLIKSSKEVEYEVKRFKVSAAGCWGMEATAWLVRVKMWEVVSV